MKEDVCPGDNCAQNIDNAKSKLSCFGLLFWGLRDQTCAEAEEGGWFKGFFC